MRLNKFQRSAGIRQRGNTLVIILAGLIGLSISGGILAYKSGFLSKSQNSTNSNNTKLTDSPTPQNVKTQDSEPEADDREDDNLTTEQLEQWIDSVGGHPDDPQLPNDILGASDQLLQSIDTAEVATLLVKAKDYALSKKDKPRLAFALGRAALAHGYNKLGLELLNDAASNGSVAAMAYLGMVELEKGNSNRAASLINKALQGGFDNAELKQLLIESAQDDEKETEQNKDSSTEIVDLLDFSKFKRPDIISAFYKRDFAGLNNDWVSMTYALSLHDTLWAGGDILFLTEDMRIMIELDPRVAAQGSYKMESSTSMVSQKTGLTIETLWNIKDSIMGSPLIKKILYPSPYESSSSKINDVDVSETVAGTTKAAGKLAVNMKEARMQAIFDARRLALGYAGDPKTFRKIYSGLAEFVLSQ